MAHLFHASKLKIKKEQAIDIYNNLDEQFWMLSEKSQSQMSIYYVISFLKHRKVIKMTVIQVEDR